MKKQIAKKSKIILLIAAMIVQLITPLAVYADPDPLVPDTPEGNGSQEEPYLMDSPDDLLWVSQNFASQDGFYDLFFLQTEDIDMTGYEEIKPIGSENTPFSATYDGDGYAISDLTMTGSGELHEFGLFGYIGEDGVIKNLTLKDAQVAVEGSDSIFFDLGLLAGTNYGFIKHCKITAESSLNASDNGRLGALAGYNSGWISKCTNEAGVTASADDSVVGGLVGENNGMVINSINKGAVTSDESDVPGGIAGKNVYGDIYYCLNSGDLAENGAGIIGIYEDGESRGNYFLDSTAESGIAEDRSEEGAPFDSCFSKSDADLKQMDTFDGWDFDNNWSIDEENSYPEPLPAIPADSLQAEAEPGSVPGTTSIILEENLQEGHSLAVINCFWIPSYPDAGDPAPLTEELVIYPYTEGGNISIDNSGPKFRRPSLGFIAVYDVNALGNIEGYALVTLTAADIKAPSVDDSGSWEVVGEAGFSPGEASVYDTSIAFDSHGAPYVSFIDADSRKITVMKYDGDSWGIVGKAGFSAAEAFNASLALDKKDVPYVVYSDESCEYKATVMKFNGSVWEPVGSPGFTEGEANRISFVIGQDNMPYIAFTDDSYVGFVMKFDGSDWQPIGDGGFSGSEIYNTSIAVDPAGIPYVAFQGGYEDESYVSSVKYTGSEWETVGSNGFPAYSYDPSMVVDKNGTPYVLYSDMMRSGKITVKKYVDDEWITVGYEGFSKSRPDNTKIAINSQEVPFAAFIDNESEKVNAMKYDEGKSSWVILEKENFSPSYADDMSFAMDPGGTPYVAFCDGNCNSKVTVMKFKVEAPSPEDQANAAIFTAKALLPTSLTASEDSITNLLTYLREISGISGTGVSLSIVSSNSNVANDGTITFTGGAVTGDVVVHINKEYGTEDTQTIAVTVPAHSSGGGGGNGGGSKNNDKPNNVADVTFNGQNQSAGTQAITKEAGKTVTTVTVDDKKMEAQLSNNGNKATIVIPVANKSDVVVGQLNGETVKLMETKEATLQIKTENVSYTLPASQINIDSISQQIGENVELKDIKVKITVASPSDDTATMIESTADKNNYQLVVKPVEFSITCTTGTKTVEVSRFNGYVDRTVAIPDGVDPSKITTGIVLNKDGTFSHVPTQIVVVDGKYYAKINSLTNSTYSVIYNPVVFADVKKHWAKESINNMGSRLIISGVGDNSFEPNRDITRAEFAAVMVRALGLKPGTGETKFSDVKAAGWYAGYVETASEYGIITGYSDGAFRPGNKITREQAMTMIARAMKITGLSVSLNATEIDALLGKYKDGKAAADYAESGIAACLKTGVVSGRSSSMVAPKGDITRAEIAVIIERLLKNSKLI